MPLVIHYNLLIYWFYRIRKSLRSCVVKRTSSASDWGATACPSPGRPYTSWTLWTVLAVWRETLRWRWVCQVSLQIFTAELSRVVFKTIHLPDHMPSQNGKARGRSGGTRVSWDAARWREPQAETSRAVWPASGLPPWQSPTSSNRSYCYFGKAAQYWFKLWSQFTVF